MAGCALRGLKADRHGFQDHVGVESHDHCWKTVPGPWVDGLMRVLAFEGGTGCDSDPQATSPSKIIPNNAVVHPQAVRGLGWPT